MAESRLLPCNFWSWPAISPLLLEQKAILTYLWTCRFSTACGGFEFPTRLAAAELGLTDPVFCEALCQFKGLGLIDFDETTSEVFIVGWFRFHKFTTGPQVMNFLRSKNKINSPAIQKRVTEASVAARVPQSLKKVNYLKIKEIKVNINTNTNVNKIQTARPSLLRQQQWSCALMALKKLERRGLRCICEKKS